MRGAGKVSGRVLPRSVGGQWAAEVSGSVGFMGR